MNHDPFAPPPSPPGGQAPRAGGSADQPRDTHPRDPHPREFRDLRDLPPGAGREAASLQSLELEAAQTRVDEAEARVAELQEALLRAKAETENVRRRGEEEVAKARKFAIESFAESLVPVHDSLEAALANRQAGHETMIEGVETTLRQLDSAFDRHKLVAIAPAVGDRFNPHQEQAIGTVPAPGQEPNTIVTLLQKGFLINDRVLRPALVMVAAAG